MSEGNGHVRVGGGAADRPRGEPDRGPEATSDAPERTLPRVLRPGPATLVALVLGAFGFGGWQVATWRVAEGSVVPCGSFTPNPDVWQPRVFRGSDPDRTSAILGGAGRDRPAAEQAWRNAALRETAGTARCAELIGRSEQDVRLLLGEPTFDRGDDGGLDLAPDEAQWSTTGLGSRSTEGRRETTAVIVRFAGGRAVAVRTARRVRDAS